jgi:hypothetical protein
MYEKSGSENDLFLTVRNRAKCGLLLCQFMSLLIIIMLPNSSSEKRRGSSASKVTGCELDGQDAIPCVGLRHFSFRHCCFHTGSAAHLASYPIDTGDKAAGV